MSSILFITALVSSYLCIVEGQSCMTATGGNGDCVVINRCQPLLTLITKKDKTQKDLDILRQSHCGYDKTTPKVCCPGPCQTINGQTGKCVQINACPQLSKLLTAQASQADIALVKNSRCNGIDQYSVCCSDTLDVTRPSVGPTQYVPPGECKLTAAPPDPGSDCCGVDGSAGNRIVGGNETAIDQYPWLTIIEYIGRDNRLRLLCGGALVSGKYVLTAGHCVTGAVLNFGTPTNVRLGEYDTTHKGPDCVTTEGGGNDCTLEVAIIPIERIIPHPDYNPQDKLKRNDIALLKLRNVAQYSDFVRPICLPTQDISAYQQPLEKRLFAAGWGADETRTSSRIKLHVDLPFVQRTECEIPYIDPKRNVPLWKGQVCAGGEKGKDSCKGDSGGPLMYENGKIYEVIGIVSFGPTPCGIENIPGVYTNVYEYLPWIRSQMTP